MSFLDDLLSGKSVVKVEPTKAFSVRPKPTNAKHSLVPSSSSTVPSQPKKRKWNPADIALDPELYTSYRAARRKEFEETQRQNSLKNLSVDSSKQSISELKRQVKKQEYEVKRLLSESDEFCNKPIETLRDCQVAVNRLRECDIVAADCEWSGKGREASLCLVQIAFKSKYSDRTIVYLFDIFKGGIEFFKEGGLAEILESESIIKVFHDVRQDSDVLYHSKNVYLKNVIDTQVMFSIYQRQSTGNTPLPVSLNTLLKKYTDAGENKHKEQAHLDMENNSKYWETRPMTEVMIQYSREDVLYLLTVYKHLWASIEPMNHHLVHKFTNIYLDQIRSKEVLEPEKKHVRGQDVPKYNIPVWDRFAKSRLEYVNLIWGNKMETKENAQQEIVENNKTADLKSNVGKNEQPNEIEQDANGSRQSDHLKQNNDNNSQESESPQTDANDCSTGKVTKSHNNEDSTDDVIQCYSSSDSANEASQDCINEDSTSKVAQTEGGSVNDGVVQSNNSDDMTDEEIQSDDKNSLEDDMKLKGNEIDPVTKVVENDDRGNMEATLMKKDDNDNSVSKIVEGDEEDSQKPTSLKQSITELSSLEENIQSAGTNQKCDGSDNQLDRAERSVDKHNFQGSTKHGIGKGNEPTKPCKNENKNFKNTGLGDVVDQSIAKCLNFGKSAPQTAYSEHSARQKLNFYDNSTPYYPKQGVFKQFSHPDRYNEQQMNLEQHTTRYLGPASQYGHQLMYPLDQSASYFGSNQYNYHHQSTLYPEQNASKYLGPSQYGGYQPAYPEWNSNSFKNTGHANQYVRQPMYLEQNKTQYFGSTRQHSHWPIYHPPDQNVMNYFDPSQYNYHQFAYPDPNEAGYLGHKQYAQPARTWQNSGKGLYLNNSDNTRNINQNITQRDNRLLSRQLEQHNTNYMGPPPTSTQDEQTILAERVIETISDIVKEMSEKGYSRR